MIFSIVFTIRAARAQDHELCPIEDLRKCLTSVENIVFDVTGNRKGLPTVIDIIFPLLYYDMVFADDLCEKTIQNDGSGVIDDLCALKKKGYPVDFLDCNGDGDESRTEPSGCDNNDSPTSRNGNCFAVSTENYKAYSYPTITLIVDGMDYAGGKLF